MSSVWTVLQIHAIWLPSYFKSLLSCHLFQVPNPDPPVILVLPRMERRNYNTGLGVSVAVIKYHDKRLGKQRVYFSLQFYITVHHWERSGQEFKGRNLQAGTQEKARRNAAYRLAPCLAQSDFLYAPVPPAHGWHHSQWAGLGPTTSITN